jgi:hypothetical protein
MMRCDLLLFCLLVLLLPGSLHADALFNGPLFDGHLHYSKTDAQVFSPQDIITRLENNNIRYAVVSSTPASHAAALYRHAPDRIVPLLDVYHKDTDKSNWLTDAALPSYVEAELRKAHWQGIGELHIFASDRHSPVFRQLVLIASQRRLPLQIHGDPVVIDTVYDIAPQQQVIWAHAGTYPYPDLIADYLKRYPYLYVDLSMRDGRIAPDGQLDDSWYELFVAYPDRFMIGVDTYSLSRWQDFDTAVKTLRGWLAQLPDDTAARLSYGNAASLFGKNK